MKLKTNKPKTFADVAKPIQNLIEKAKSRPASQARDNTIMLLEKQLDDLFAKQEAIKEAQNPQPEMPMGQPEMANGGYLNKYFGGDPTNTGSPVDLRNTERENNILNYGNPFNYLNAGGNQSMIPNVTPIGNMNKRGINPLPVGSFKPTATPLAMPNLKPLQKPEESSKPTQGFNRWGEVGALASGLASTFRQNRNINNVDRPDLLNNVYLSAGAAPDKVDYSAELNALNSDIGAAKEGLRLGGGNTSTMMSNIGALRAQQLQRRGQIMQGQENANTELMNNYKARQAEAGMKSQLTNAGIAQENMANEFGYNQWLAKQRNAAIANETQLSNDVFNNMTNRQNQLAAAGIMANANPSTVLRDAIKGNKDLADAMLKAGKISQEEYNQALGLAYGGMKYAQGGSVYKQKLQNVLQDKTVDRAAQMDAEYEQALKEKKSTFKSNVTGLEYKVLPRGEKDLYAAKLWKDALGTAPTKSQKEATKKALEGKPTSSEKAKAVVSTVNSSPKSWSTDKPSWLTPQMEQVQKAVNKDRDALAEEKRTVKSLKMFNPAAADYYEKTGDLQGALDNFVAPDRFDESSGAAGFSIGKAIKEGNATGLDYTNLALMATKLGSLKKSPKALGPEPPQFMESITRNAELAKARNARGKGSYTYRQKQANAERAANWENSGRRAKLDIEATPEFMNRKRNAILNQEDESFVYSQNRVKNKRLDKALSENEVPEFSSLVSSENASLKNKIRIIEANLTKAKNSKDAKKIAYWTNKKLSVMEDNYAFGGMKK